MLRFSPANTKLKKLQKKTGRKVYSLDLLSGHNCPYAKDCLSYAMTDPSTGRHYIKDGPDTLFRCYSASQEAQYPNTFNMRESNTNIVKAAIGSKAKLVKLIESAMPAKVQTVRIHSSGDFMVQKYFDAWIEVARNHRDKIFYAYTKSLPFWVKRFMGRPINMKMTASYGGKRDDLIESESLRYALVVKNQEQADKLGLKVDNDDSLAADLDYFPSFALIIHGPQAPQHGDNLLEVLK